MCRFAPSSKDSLIPHAKSLAKVLLHKWNAWNVCATLHLDRDTYDHSTEMGDHTLPVNTLTDKNTLNRFARKKHTCASLVGTFVLLCPLLSFLKQRIGVKV